MNDNVSVYDMVDNIVQVVFHTHYSYITDYELKRDLLQVGYLKAYEMLNNGNYDPTMPLRTFLYTGIRNEIHNTLYHLGKIPTVSLDGLDVYENVVGYNQVADFTVETSVIRDVCNKFIKHGDYYSVVYNYLVDLGVVGGKKCKPTIDHCCSSYANWLITLTLWSLYEDEVANG